MPFQFNIDDISPTPGNDGGPTSTKAFKENFDL